MNYSLLDLILDPVKVSPALVRHGMLDILVYLLIVTNRERIVNVLRYKTSNHLLL